MGMTTAQYQQALQALLPQGAAWPREPSATLSQVLEGWAGPLAQLDDDIDEALAELLPSTTISLLADWEQALSLPESAARAQTNEERQMMVLARMRDEGATEPIKIIGWLRLLGFPTELRQFSTVTCVGDCVQSLFTPGKGLECIGSCAVPVLTWTWLWCIEFSLKKAVSLETMTCEDNCSSTLAQWADVYWETLCRLSLPAHCYGRFVYTSRNLFREAGWLLSPAEGSVMLSNEVAMLSLPPNIIAPFDSVNGYAGPSLKKTIRPVNAAYRLRVQVASLTSSVDGYNNIGCGLTSADGSMSYSVLVTGNGMVYGHSHHTNTNLFSVLAGVPLWLHLHVQSMRLELGYSMDGLNVVMIGSVEFDTTALSQVFIFLRQVLTPTPAQVSAQAAYLLLEE